MHLADFMPSFAHELEKTALSGGVLGWAHPLLKNHYGRQMMVGAALGGGIGAATDNEDRMRGMARGALLGAGAIGAGHLATNEGRRLALGNVKDFGKRNIYGMTGRGFTHPNDIAGAKKIGLLGENASKYDLAAHQEGWNTLPGVAKGLVTKPGKVLHNAWERQGTLGKVLTGLSVADLGYQAATPDVEGGPGKAERLLGSGLGPLGYILAPGTLAPMMAMGTASGMAGRTLGRVIDRRRAAAAPQAAEQAPEQLPEQPYVGG